jgi:phenylalanyl-tRNA synthetase beta chain
LKISPDELKEKLTFSGIEVENVIKTGEILKQIIITEVVEKEKHPDADKLSVCKVYDGQQTHQVVCGAPNCSANIKIAFAPVGTEFPDFKLKKAKLRGIESNGMICSEKELGISENHDGIMILPNDAQVGETLDKYLDITDTIYEVEITPNRPDLLGMIGIARDISAQLNIPIKEYQSGKMSFVKSTGNFEIKNSEPILCTRYVAVRFKDVKIAPSPDWLIKKLQIADIKPINNVVDITNLVMYEFGHPLHAFDANMVEGNNIIIRKSREKELFPALDNNTYTLTGNELVIADSTKPVALAGVIGGKNSHITENTTDIILEAACFDPSITRRTSYNFKIFTDSSYRFERGMANKTCELIAERATELITKITGANVINNEILDDYPNIKQKTIIELRPTRVKKLLGIQIDNKTIVQYMQSLGLMLINEKEDNLTFEIPEVRIDLTREIDLIEEIIRLYGYNNFPEKETEQKIMDKSIFDAKRDIKNFLVQNGFYEAINLSFTDPVYLDFLQLNDDDYRRKTVNILNPQGQSFSIMRSTLLPQLLKNALLHINHSNMNIKMFELNKIFISAPLTETLRLSGIMTGQMLSTHWKTENQNITFFDIKGIVVNILNYLHIFDIDLYRSTEPFYLPNYGFDIKTKGKLLGSIGRLDQKVLQKFDLEGEFFVFDLDLEMIFANADFRTIKFKDTSKFPSVKRDISFIINTQHEWNDIKKTIKSINHDIIKGIFPFDEYKGQQIEEGFRSLSISILINSDVKTLQEEDIKLTMNKIIEKLKEKFNIIMR